MICFVQTNLKLFLTLNNKDGTKILTVDLSLCLGSKIVIFDVFPTVSDIVKAN